MCPVAVQKHRLQKVSRLRQLPGKVRIVFFFTLLEADILQHQGLTVGKIVYSLLHLRQPPGRLGTGCPNSSLRRSATGSRRSSVDLPGTPQVGY